MYKRQISSKPLLSGRSAKWAMLLSPFDIKLLPQKVVKGQVIDDFLVPHIQIIRSSLMLVETKLCLLYFDGTSRSPELE